MLYCCVIRWKRLIDALGQTTAHCIQDVTDLMVIIFTVLQRCIRGAGEKVIVKY
jgi:hypothetical protein